MSAISTANSVELWGIDFTSAPSGRKPIVAVQGFLSGKNLTIKEVHYWDNFSLFEGFLTNSNTQPWLAGVDIPLGMPKPFVEGLQWPTKNWVDSMTAIQSLSKEDYRQAITSYQAKQAPGSKQPKRLCDTLAKALSPTKLHYIPTALMLYEGATRIAGVNTVSIWPCRVLEDSQQRIVEAYPGLLFRTLAEHQHRKSAPYKSDSSPTPAHKQQRQQLVEQLLSPSLAAQYEVSLNCPAELQEAMIDNSTGDTLDAVACCIQAAWAYLHWETLPQCFPNALPVEGWIVDPTLRSNHSVHASETP